MLDYDKEFIVKIFKISRGKNTKYIMFVIYIYRIDINNLDI